MPRSWNVRSSASSLVSSTAPAGIPAAPMICIASCLSCSLVHADTMALTSSSRAARLAEHGTAEVARLWILDLHHFGANPRKRLGARRTRLELRKVQHPHPVETAQGLLRL